MTDLQGTQASDGCRSDLLPEHCTCDRRKVHPSSFDHGNPRMQIPQVASTMLMNWTCAKIKDLLDVIEKVSFVYINIT